MSWSWDSRCWRNGRACWSQAGIVTDLQTGTFLSVPLRVVSDSSQVPPNNGIELCLLRDYDSPRRFPNLAFIDFGGAMPTIEQDIEKIRAQRSIIDLVSLMIPWLAFVWGARQHGNPLLDGHGIPSAGFVEMAYGIGGVELTPGLSSQTGCPEAIWQSAKWWRSYYEQASERASDRARAAVPTGCYVVGQREAAVVDTKPRRRPGGPPKAGRA